MKQPNRWSCVPTAFAIILGVPVEELIEEIGHDGSEIWWENAIFPTNLRGFHVQELTDCCLRRGYNVTQIEPRPMTFSPELLSSKEVTFNDPDRFRNILRGRCGVLAGLAQGKFRHAVAWNGNQIIDPSDGQEKPLKNFAIQYFYYIQK